MNDLLSRLIGVELGSVPRLEPRSAPRAVSGAGRSEVTPAIVEEHIEREWADGVPTGTVQARRVDGRTGRALPADGAAAVSRAGPSVAASGALAAAAQSAPMLQRRSAGSEAAARPALPSIVSTRLPVASGAATSSAVEPSSRVAEAPAHDARRALAASLPTTLALGGPGADPPPPVNLPQALGVATAPAVAEVGDGTSPGVRSDVVGSGIETLPPSAEIHTQQSSDHGAGPPPMAPVLQGRDDRGGPRAPLDAARRGPRATGAPRGASSSSPHESDAVPSLDSVPSLDAVLAPMTARGVPPPARPRVTDPLASTSHGAGSVGVERSSNEPDIGPGLAAAPRRPSGVNASTRTAVASPVNNPVLGAGIGSGGLADAIRAYAASSGAAPSTEPVERRAAATDAGPAGSVVRVRIGRLEIHAAAPVAAPSAAPQRRRSGLSLDELLRRREES
jgi:hypothetical protein